MKRQHQKPIFKMRIRDGKKIPMRRRECFIDFPSVLFFFPRRLSCNVFFSSLLFCRLRKRRKIPFSALFNAFSFPFLHPTMGQLFDAHNPLQERRREKRFMYLLEAIFNSFSSSGEKQKKLFFQREKGKNSYRVSCGGEKIFVRRKRSFSLLSFSLTPSSLP